MITNAEKTLLDKLFGDLIFAIFKTTAGFLPSDRVLALGTYLKALGSDPRPVAVGANIASAVEVTPTAAVNHVTGVAAIDTITASASLQNGLVWTVIPDGVFSWTTNDNIALAGTAVVGKVLEFVYDQGTAAWYPSYVA